MRVRDIIGLILALTLAVGVAFLTRVFLTKEEKGGGEVVVKPAQLTKVLVAEKNLAPGDKIKAGDLIWQDWPKNTVAPNYLTAETTRAEEFTGAVVRFPIHKENPVIREELVMPGEKGILAAVVSPGKRAVSIDVTAASSDSGLIFPGDYVDVILATSVLEKGAQSGKSRTILRNIKVLAIDTMLIAPEEKPKTPPHEATLEVTPAQAEILMAGAREGTLTLSLHSMEKGEVQSASELQPEGGLPENKQVTIMRGKEKSVIQVQEK